MVTNLTLQLDGDTATDQAYWQTIVTRECKSVVAGAGHYEDVLKREDGRWRVSHRTVLRDWAISLPVQQDWTATAGLRDGARSDEDPSFAALGLKHGGIRSADGLSWR